MNNCNRFIAFLSGLLFSQSLYSHEYSHFIEELPAKKSGKFLDSPWAYIDFDESMRIDVYDHYVDQQRTKKLLGVDGKALLAFFKDLYDRHSPLRIQAQEQPKIPKIMHQIWIGDKVPDEFKEFQESWRTFHPDWEYRLWTQHDLPGLQLQNGDLIAQSRNPGEISDMMRYEILYRYGGVYVDMDCECLQPLDRLHHTYDFYIGIQPLDSELVQLGIGIIGSIPGHPLLKYCIDGVKETWYNGGYAQEITARTGPIYFTKIFFAYAGNGTCDIALPAHYFYPLGSQEYEIKKDLWVDQGSFAIHHWAKTWLLPSFRRPQFQTIKNYGKGK